MHSVIYEDLWIVAVDHAEALRLGAGDEVTDRKNPFDLLGKTSLRSLTQTDPHYEPAPEFMHKDWWHNFNTRKCVAHMFGDMDLVIYVPHEVAQHAFVASEHIARADIDILHTDYAQELRAKVPEGGIEVRFDGGNNSPAFREELRERL